MNFPVLIFLCKYILICNEKIRAVLKRMLVDSGGSVGRSQKREKKRETRGFEAGKTSPFPTALSTLALNSLKF